MGTVGRERGGNPGQGFARHRHRPIGTARIHHPRRQGTAIEVVADELGPSLRWATAQVERQSGQGGGGGNRNANAGAANRGDDPYMGDEEPF